MADYATARVSLWGQDVGALAESDAGRITFEYEPGFRATGLEISPIHLPLDRAGPVEFPELARRPAFLGLPGVFADALPDRFGNEIIKRYFEARGRPADAMSPLQRLLYIGDRAMGALTFHPALPSEDSTEEALEVRTLVDQARRIIEGDAPVAVPEIMQVGGSAGGARAKALVLWHRGENRIRSGHARPRPGEEPWLIKFDGVTRDAAGQGMHVDRHPSPWGRIEYTYARMATDAGVEMSDTHLLQDGDLGHFMTRRFDRPDSGERLHMHSLGGIQHVDYNDQFVFSYEAFFDTVRALGLGQQAVDQAFRRMVFAVATVNYDDHVKNSAFLMRRSGAWSLAPAFDVAYAENADWTRQHQMSVNGKFRGVTRADLLAVGALFDVPADGARIIDDVMESLASWRAYAEEAGVPDAMIDHLEGRFEQW
jgi:serine/threonine-protein kinase HipA